MLGVGLLAASPDPARAAEGPVPLIVTRSESSRDCPDGPALARTANRVLERSVFWPGAISGAQTFFHVEIWHDELGYHAWVRVAGNKLGNRGLSDHSDRCEALGEALAVTLAITIDAWGTPGMVAPGGVETTAPRRARPPVESSSSEVEVSAGATMGLPNRPVGTLGGGWRWWLGRRGSVALGASYVFDQTVPVGARAIELGVWYGSLRGCVMAVGKREQVGVSVCAEPRVGMLTARGRDFGRNELERLPWVALGGGVMGQGRMGRSARFFLGAMLHVPLIRQGFSVIQSGKRTEEVSFARAGGLLMAGFSLAL